MTEALTLDKNCEHGSQAHLLIIDDDPGILASLSPLLEDKGFQVDTVQDGLEACRKTQARGYDLVVLDMVMPGMSGLQVLAWLRDASPDVPVVVISGRSAFKTVRQALRQGAFDYIRKPYDIDHLIATIRQALHHHRHVRARAAEQLYLTSSEEFYRRAMETLPDLIFTLDRQGRFLFITYRVEELLGYRHEDLIGQNFHYLMDEHEVPKPSVIRKHDHVPPAPVTQELRLKTRGSERANRDYEVTVLPFTGGTMPGLVELIPAPSQVEFVGVARDVTERKKAEVAVNYLASHDSLTGLPNRTLFKDRLILSIAHARRNNQKLAVMFLDLNRFKAVNDIYGHRVGDQLLQSVTFRLKACLREVDTLSRFGGDEFTLLLPATATAADAKVIGDKLIQTLKAPFYVQSPEVSISIGISIGIALFPDAGDTADSLVERADVAMYRVKRRGDDDYEFYN